jgi:hypothetical protein
VCNTFLKPVLRIYLKFPDFFGEHRGAMSDVAGEAGHPLRVSRKGKARPLEPGRGNHSPPANPERLSSKAPERELPRCSPKGTNNRNIINKLRR